MIMMMIMIVTPNVWVACGMGMIGAALMMYFGIHALIYMIHWTDCKNGE